jgi:hypothetical protein
MRKVEKVTGINLISSLKEARKWLYKNWNQDEFSNSGTEPRLGWLIFFYVICRIDCPV